MKRFQDTPAFWRYFGARLKPFTRPLFLGSVGFLTLSGITIYQYWHHPDWLHNKIEQPLEAALGSRSNQPIPETLEEDLAALADVDNIDLLLKEMAQNQITNSFNAASSQSNQKNQDNSNTAFTRFKQKQESKFRNPSSSNSNYLKINGNSALTDLLKPPTISGYPSNLPTATKTNLTSDSSTSATIANPVGRLYRSNSNSALTNTVTTPYLKTSPLSKLGDRSGNITIRQPGINITEISNPISTTNPSPSNFPNRFASPSSTTAPENTITNSQSRERSLPQSQFNTYIAPSTNYNQTVPRNYQLQPRSFGQKSPRGFNQINSTNSSLLNSSPQTSNQLYQNNSLSNGILRQQLNSNPNQSVTQSGQFNNQPFIQSTPNPTLQPAGSLSTSPLR